VKIPSADNLGNEDPLKSVGCLFGQHPILEQTGGMHDAAEGEVWGNIGEEGL
jgi:hypothetical protein